MTRVRLNESARARFPDIGERTGKVIDIKGTWQIVQWPDGTSSWLDADDLEDAQPAEPTL